MSISVPERRLRTKPRASLCRSRRRISYLAASGNEVDISTPELIDHYLDDPQTKIVVWYIEGLTDRRALMEAGRKAATVGKPILLWKGGRRQQGLRAAASHRRA